MSARKIKAVQVFVLVISLFLTVMPPTAMATQEARGTITGKVVDAQRGLVADASVVISNVAMGTSVTIKTNDEGVFRALYLIPGTYQVVVQSQGFKRYVRDGVVLRTNDTLALDIQLEVGAVDQSVTIVADAPLLETTTASQGTVVDSRRVAEQTTAFLRTGRFAHLR